MNLGLYQSAASMSSLERWQDAVSQNITSAQNTGYRKRTVQFSAEIAGEMHPNARSRVGQDAGMAVVFPKSTSGISFVTGETQPTRRELDVAIQGEGFFEIQTPDGGKIYTRNGEFRTRPDRTLVTSGDMEVLSDAGNPIKLLPGGGGVSINRDGTVSQSGARLGKIAIFDTPNPAALIPSSGGMFFAPPGVEMTKVEEPEIMQGYLEQSNVAPLREMVDLVLISRAYEANQKMITAIDQQMQKSLDALG